MEDENIVDKPPTVMKRDYVLSIDVGIKNLAFCIMRSDNPNDFKTYEIVLWDVYNTLEEEIHLCSDIMKNGKICNKKCSYTYTYTYTYTSKCGNDKIQKFCCKTHFPSNVKMMSINKIKKKNRQLF